MENCELFHEFLKFFMKPGHIYFKGNDGEIYEADIGRDFDVTKPIYLPPLKLKGEEHG